MLEISKCYLLGFRLFLGLVVEYLLNFIGVDGFELVEEILFFLRFLNISV